MNTFKQIFSNPFYSQEARGTVWGQKVTLSYSVKRNGYATLGMDNFYIRINKRVYLILRQVRQAVQVPLDEAIAFGLDPLGTCFQEVAVGNEKIPLVTLNGDRRKIIILPDESWRTQWQDALSVNEVDDTHRYARRTGLLSHSSVVGKIITAKIPFEFGRKTYDLGARYVYYEGNNSGVLVNRLAFLGFVLSEEREYQNVRTLMG